eukprot:scaffold196517_cov49-Attheya_sp.AAC.3
MNKFGAWNPGMDLKSSSHHRQKENDQPAPSTSTSLTAVAAHHDDDSICQNSLSVTREQCKCNSSLTNIRRIYPIYETVVNIWSSQKQASSKIVDPSCRTSVSSVRIRVPV